MAVHKVSLFSSVASLTLSVGDTVHVGADGVVYKVYDALTAPSSRLHRPIKKQGTKILVPYAYSAIKGTDMIYDATAATFNDLKEGTGGHHIRKVNFSSFTKEALQTYYDFYKSSKINSPTATTPVNLMAMYSGVSLPTFSEYALILYNDLWYYSVTKGSSVSFNKFNGGGGKDTFGAAVDLIFIPNS